MQVFMAEFLPDQRARLDAQETRHCSKVLRHQVGDFIHCINGEGLYLFTRIDAIHRDHTDLTVLKTTSGWGEHPGQLILAVSPLRLKDRFEWLIEKAVELGVNEIVPLRCARTDPYKAKFKPERLQTIITTALKQCMRSRLPILRPIEDFSSWLQPLDGSGLGFIAQAQASLAFSTALASTPAQSLTLLIGPEGDFTREEMDAARQAGYQPVSLGHNRLRSETAALHALSLIKGSWAY